MKIAVFGPTGGTGRQIVAQALTAGHEVTAFTRNPLALDARQGPTIVAGATHDQTAIERAIAGSEAVLCALGGRPWRRHERVCSTAVSNIAREIVGHEVITVPEAGLRWFHELPTGGSLRTLGVLKSQRGPHAER